MISFPTRTQHSPPTLPCVRHAADDGAEHEGCDEGKEHQVDQAFQTVIAQPRHSLYIVLRMGKNKQTKRKTFSHTHRNEMHHTRQGCEI